MKKEFMSLRSFMMKDRFNLIVFGLSFLILIIGTIVFNFFISLFIFLLINLIWIIPYFKWREKLEERDKLRNSRLNSSNLGENETIGEVDVMPKKRVKKTKKTKKKKSIFKIILLLIFLFIILCFIAGGLFIGYIVMTAGKFDPNKLYSKEASTLLDSNGDVYAKLGTEMRQKIEYSDMSEELVNAIIATEDSRFFEHNGFDLPRFLKASFGQALGKNAGGASTLTMQVSKNQFTSTTSHGFAGIKRKFTDIYIAMFQIEKKYSKEKILEFYANSYYLGSGCYGVEQASQTYFNKKAKDLNVSEAAMIAGMFQSPVSYDPNINPERTENRRKIVLSLMKRHGYITNNEYEIAKKMTVDKIVIKGRSANTSSNEYQGFIDTVASEVEEKTGYNPYSYSMKIYTTMDKSKQDAMNRIMNGTDYSWENDKVEAGVIALDNKTGAIVAVGSGRNKTGARSRNNATQIKRQIGSTAKPMYDYGPAIEYNNWNPSTLILDEKYTYSNGTEINNWDGGYKGMMTIRQALIESRNIPALKTFQNVENGKVKEFVESIGLSPELDNGFMHEAHAIGGYTGESPMTVAGAYESFANGGYYVAPYSFTKIEFDKDGKTYENNVEKKQVMSPETAYMVTDMLIDTGKNALGSYSNVNGTTFGAKTGTTNFDKKTLAARRLPSNAVNDLWVAGISPDYTITVWYGYETNSTGYYNKFGSSQNSRLFNAVAKNFFKSGSKFEKPSSIVEVTVERNCGTPLLPGPNTPADAMTTEIFKEGSKPTEASARFNTLGNVTDLKASVTGNKATITWKEIGTPEGLNPGYWQPIINKSYNSSKDQASFLNYVMGYNNSVLGNVVYNVYIKNGGGLQLLTTVSGGSANVKLPNVSNPKIVVKSSYSNFGGAESSGVETQVDYKGISASDVTITPTSEKIERKAGSNFNYKPSVKATAHGEDISSEITVSKPSSIVDKKTGEKVNDNTISNTAGTYLVTYDVKYADVSVGKVEVTVVVTEEGE
ncbi:MAG: transglycosylase domain-containing protein [Bacilli bacterium]|nr:transglycosylase domain-containing protein [Bacilli bacterium]